jgi:hypothetical protein
MRPALRWTLAGAVALSVAAMWSSEAPRIVDASSRAMAGTERRASLVTGSPKARAAALPAEWNRVVGPAASRDPFSTPAPVPAPAAVVVPPVVVASYEPPPAPVSMPFRYLGRFVSPDGQANVFLGHADAIVPIGKGMSLDGGFVVDDITEQSIQLAHAASQQKFTIPVPEAR